MRRAGVGASASPAAVVGAGKGDDDEVVAVEEVDSSEMLGLRTRAATAIVCGLALVMFLGILLTRTSAGRAAVEVGIALVITAATILVFRRRGARLPARDAALATGLLAATALASAGVHGAEPDLVTINWLRTGWIVPQTFMAARGRPWWAVGSFVLGVVVTAGGVVLLGGDPAQGLASHLGQVPLLLMSIVFGLAIERRARDITALRSRSREKTDEQAAAAATLVTRDERLGWVRETAGPMLERIACGERFSDAELVDAAVLEAHIRDTIRAPGLTGEPLDAEVEAARRRGVTVILLDDGGTGGLGPTVTARARELARARVSAAEAPGRVVVRLLPPGRKDLLSFAGDASPGRRSYTAHELTAAESTVTDGG